MATSEMASTTGSNVGRTAIKESLRDAIAGCAAAKAPENMLPILPTTGAQADTAFDIPLAITPNMGPARSITPPSVSVIAGMRSISPCIASCTYGSAFSPRLVSITLPAFFSFDAIADTEFVWILNARSVAPAASPIAAVFSAKASACAPVSASTAFLDSMLENRFAKATSSPLTDSFSFVRIPPSPSLSSAAAPDV